MGTHILLSLYGVNFELLEDITSIILLFDRVTCRLGATVLNKFSYKFEPQGVSVVYTLSESHLSLHSFPEKGSVAIDCYTCGSMDTRAGAQMFIEFFNPTEICMREVPR